MQIIATGSDVIVDVIYAENCKTIILPDTAKQYSGDFIGQVVAIGPENEFKEIQIGDKLPFRRHEGKKVTAEDGKTLLVLSEKWVEAKIND